MSRPRLDDPAAIAAAFDAMPVLGPLRLPGAQDYAARCLREARAAAERVPVAMSRAYGDDPFQRLDVWVPADALAARAATGADAAADGDPAAAGVGSAAAGSGGRPVLVYWHGGALLAGHKEWIGAMAPAVTAMGAILVSPDYRLVPRVPLPAPLEDARAAVGWVAREIARYGGDPRRLVLAGHSAGGYLAALVALDRARLAAHGVDASAIRACLPLSGFFEIGRGAFAAGDVRQRLREALSREVPDEDAAEAIAARGSASAHLGASPPVEPSFFLAWGERDLPELIPDNERLASALAARGRLLGSHVLPGADHFEAHFASFAPGSAWMGALQRALAGDATPAA